MDRDAVAHLRPHFSRKGERVFFLVARRPALELRPEEIGLFDAIDGSRNVGWLAAAHAGAELALARWHEAGVVELVEAREPPPAHPHLVVVEPHIDDAILSTGGRMLRRAGRQRITILTLAPRSNFTSYWFKNRFPFDLETVTSLRRREGALAARLVGAEHRVMDGLEANLRFVPPERWSEASFSRLYAAYEPFLHSTPSLEETEATAERLSRALDPLSPDELWIPLGLGEHVDHHLTREACLEMLRRDPARLERVEVRLYQDLPYAVQLPGHAQSMTAALARHGGVLEPEREIIADVHERKMRAVSVFASQWKIEAIAPSLAEPIETAYRLQRLPGRVPPAELRPHPEVTARIARAIAPWIARRNEQRRINVVGAGPFARFGEEMERLRRFFPAAQVRVFVLEDFAWQTDGFSDPSVHVEVVPRQVSRWSRLLLAEAGRRPSPTILVRYPSWTPKHRALNQAMLRALWRHPRVLVSALEEVTALLVESVG